MNEEQNNNFPNQNSDNNVPQTPPALGQQESVDKTPENKPIGAIAGIIIIVVVLAIGGLYFWGSRLNKLSGTPQTDYINMETPVMETDTATEALEQITPGDELDVIAEELINTDLTDLDQELEAIEATF